MQSRSRHRPSALRVFVILLITSLLVLGCVVSLLAYRFFFYDGAHESLLLTIPDLTGHVLTDESLPDARYFQIVRIERFSDEPIGTVLSQCPTAGSERKAAPPNHSVTLTLHVSKGPETAAVPSVVGQAITHGKAALLSAGFAAKTVQVHSSRPAGEILSQSTPSGTILKTGTAVTLTVSLGEAIRKTTVPVLSELSAIRAKGLLESLGLKTGTVSYRDDAGEQNRVIDQTPMAGISLPEGSRVDIILSRKPPETTEPSRPEEPDSSASDSPKSDTAEPRPPVSDKKDPLDGKKESEPPFSFDSSLENAIEEPEDLFEKSFEESSDAPIEDPEKFFEQFFRKYLPGFE